MPVKKESEILDIALGRLEIDEKYQRMVNDNWVEQIAKNYNPDLADIPRVSARNGHFFVFDGQHTVKALKLLHPDDSYRVRCRVYYGLTEAMEANYFCNVNQNKKKVNFTGILRAKRVYGDVEANVFSSCTQKAGFALRDNYPISVPFGINAVRQAYKCFCELGEAKYVEMLSLIRHTWNGANWAISQNMLAGMTLLVKTFEINHKYFIAKMQDVTASDIKREISKFYSVSVARKYALAIGSLYNKHSGKKLSLEKLNFAKQ